MNPVLITSRDLLPEVCKRWRKQYPGEKIKYDQLAALDPKTATSKQVDDIIGTQGWASTGCDGCGEYVDEAVQVGQEPDCESSTANLCKSCCEKALKLFP